MKLVYLKEKTSIFSYGVSIGSEMTKLLIRTLMIVCMLLPACGTLKEIPEATNAHVIGKVPFFSQEDHHCGPASLAMVLNFWGIPADPGDIAREIFSESARGTLNIDMVLYAQGRGLSADQRKSNMGELRRFIDSAHPVIVLVDYGFYLYQVNHFMVVTGYNENGIIVNSGRDRDKYIPAKDFLKTWKRADFWTLLIKPR